MQCEQVNLYIHSKHLICTTTFKIYIVAMLVGGEIIANNFSWEKLIALQI